MKHDPGSSYSMPAVFPAASQVAATVHTTAIDHSQLPSVSYPITCGTFDTSFNAKVQYSDDNMAWIDEPDGQAGNDTAVELTAAGEVVVHVPNPRARYTRLEIVLGGTCVFAVIAVAGPRLYNPPAETTLEA